MTTRKTPSDVKHLGIGIDTARYGHCAAFLRDDKNPAAEPLEFRESREGYQKLQRRIEQLQRRYPEAQIHLRIDAAGQYAANLEHFVRSITQPAITVSVGEPKRNKDYHRAHSPKRKADATESHAMARYAVVERPPASPQTPVEFLALRRVAARLRAQVKQISRLNNQLHETLSASFPELATLVAEIKTGWVLAMLKKYPTAEKIAAARGLEKIEHLKADKARQIQTAAKNSVAALRGDVAEQLVKAQVEELQHSIAAEKAWKKRLAEAFDTLPDGPQRQIETIKGIGKLTTAAIVATAVDVKRFETANQLVGYYGVFPEEQSSGVDKLGRPYPSGKKRMCRKGNDLVRGLLFNCAKSAAQEHGGNPEVRKLYLRLVGQGTRKDVAFGYCMTKLLHQVFGVWTTGQAFDPEYAAKRKAVRQGKATGRAEAEASAQEPLHKNAPGRKEQSSKGKTVTEAPSIVPKAPISDKQSASGLATGSAPPVSRWIDFAELRSQVTMQQALDALPVQLGLRGGRGGQYRGACPIHGETADGRHRSFSVNLAKGVFRCFHPDCGAQGNVLDFWAAVKKLPLREAALDMSETFGLCEPSLNREEEPVKEPVTSPRQTIPALER